MVARRSVVAAVVSLCALFTLALVGTQAALAVEPPAVEDESVLDVSGTSATLQALVNPHGSETTYRFEYGTSEAYGSVAPVPDGFVGSNTAGVTVSMNLQGLAASTVYHYRVVAVVASRSELVYSADGTFRTQPSRGELALLDGRQWELVSPANKQGASILPIAEGGVIEAALDGHAITYLTTAASELEPQGYFFEGQVFSKRGSEGWSSQDISTPHSFASYAPYDTEPEYKSFASDLSLALVEPEGPFTPLSEESMERTPYIRDDESCAPAPSSCYRPLVTAGNVPPGTKFGGEAAFFLGEANFVGGTADLSHDVISAGVALTSTPGDQGGLYEWADGRLQLVSILPESEGGEPQSFARLGNGNQNVRNAISRDGSRIFWSGSEGLYVRDTVKQETVRIGSGRVAFQLANVDGSRVFFTAENRALEECDIVEAAGKLACSTTQLASSMRGALMGASDDGSYVYFVSNSALAPGAVSGNCEGYPYTGTLCNLYMSHDGGSGWESSTLIAVVSGLDNPDWATNDGTNPSRMTSRVSPNGQWLAFMSQRGLTGYDTRDAGSGEADEEVYLYDTQKGRLACASCNPTGARPHGSMYDGGYVHGLLGGGDRVWPNETWLAANIPGWTPSSPCCSMYQSRYLSDSGRLFFNSGDALAPQDVNGTWDVYEYEPEGAGSCASATQTFNPSVSGCVGLVSSGRSAEQAAFMDASEDGGDVFFLTADRLTGQDFDTGYDLYDAHVCSAGVPCVSSPVLPPPCGTGDSCKAAPSPQPSIFGAPSSATFAGIGNVTEISGGAVKPRSLTGAQKLKRALHACHKRRSRHRRVACERRARRRYVVKKATRGSR